jgi:hypothetical protein
MNEVEQECIILNSVWEMIDRMVNWAMFVKHDRIKPTNMMFETREHSLLFVILLGDFLSPLRAFRGQRMPLGLARMHSNTRPSDLTFLYYLRQVCTKPKLGPDASDLSSRTEAFGTWLEDEFVARGVNLPTINVVTDVRIPRYRYLKMCGDIAKHNLARLSANVARIRELLEASGQPVSEQESYLAVEDFFAWFHDNIFIYHSSQIAEFLNNIRWSIFDYLQPEFARSWHRVEGASDFAMYAYDIPGDCTEPVARAMYWDLMNRVRAKPHMHRFIVSESFKQRY